MTPLEESNFQKNLGELTLLAFLRPYLNQQAFYNNHQGKIAILVKAFFMLPRKDSSNQAAYTFDQVIKGLRSEITQDWENYPAEQEKVAEQQMLELEILTELIKAQYGVQVLNTIRDREANDTLLHSLSVNIYSNQRQNALDSLAADYRKLSAALKPYQEHKAAIKASKERQKLENWNAVQWAKEHLRHYHLLCAKVQNKGYLTLFNPVIEEQNRDKISVEIAYPDTNLDERLYNLITAMSEQAGALAYHSLTGDGVPSKRARMTKHERIVVGTLVAILGTLIVGFVFTNLLTFSSFIPTVAEHGLNHLYTSIFSGLGFVSQHHQFSFGAIYGMSVGFLGAIDIMVGYGAYRLNKTLTQIDRNARTTVYPQKIATEICQYADANCKHMDSAIDRAMDSDILQTPMRRTLLTFYSEAREAKNQPFPIKDPSPMASKFALACMG